MTAAVSLVAVSSHLQTLAHWPAQAESGFILRRRLKPLSSEGALVEEVIALCGSNVVELETFLQFLALPFPI